MKPFFITGTDTDCGKTYVTCQLADWLLMQDCRVQVLKPVASGCILQDGELFNEDVMKLQACNRDDSLPVNQWRYLPAIAPHFAAAQQGDRLCAADIAEFCKRSFSTDKDYGLVEGAGGLQVPLNESETWLNFLQLTKFSVILVVGMRLGCLNHALLTDYVLRANNLPCAGWIANGIVKDMPLLEENITDLATRMHMPLLGTVPYGGSLNMLVSELPMGGVISR